MIATSDLARRYRQEGNRRLQRGDFTAAAEFFRACLAHDPNDADAQDGLGGVAFSLGRYADASAEFARAVALRPDSARLFSNLGSALICCGRIDEGREAFTRALALDPEYPLAHLSLGSIQLLQGDFTNGWRGFEWRLGTPAQRRLQPTVWEGQPLNGARIILQEEQGFGDVIQFCRYAPLVARRGGRVTLAVSEALTPLLSALPDVELVPDAAAAIAAFAREDAERGVPHVAPWTCRLPSLPGIFGTDLTSIPADVPYLQADPARVAHMCARITAASPTPARWPRPAAAPAATAAVASSPAPAAAPGGDDVRAASPAADIVRPINVGFVWAGNPRNRRDRLRSIPLSALTPLFDLEGVTPFSLQYGPRDADRREVPGAHHVRGLERDGTTFCDTAAAIEALDLVITIDTSVAHLAGALARPVWILLAYAPDWRWLLDRDTSAWYPTARLFRQPAPDRWDLVIPQVAAALQQLVRTR